MSLCAGHLCACKDPSPASQRPALCWQLTRARCCRALSRDKHEKPQKAALGYVTGHDGERGLESPATILQETSVQAGLGLLHTVRFTAVLHVVRFNHDRLAHAVKIGLRASARVPATRC